MSKNYVVYHLHSDLSSGVTNIDSVTKYYQYVERAAELGMTALAYSEHGNVFEWYHKKLAIEKAGMKYIHAAEFYVTETRNEKIRDNYHCVLIAKNYEGFREINLLSSRSFDREDGHFYYVPRISFEELINTSNNIIVTTACIGGILAKTENDELRARFIDFLQENRDRCFLEVQHHMDDQQIQYNDYLVKLSETSGIPLIAGTDTHALNAEHAEARLVLQKSKNVHFGNEDAWDLTFKSYDELIDAYKRQGVLTEEQYMKAIQNTNVMADMVEEYNIDVKPKYPKLYQNSKEIFMQKIVDGVKWRGIDKLPADERKIYLDRINEEVATYEHNGAIDFMLLEEDYKRELRKQGVFPGYSRGSVSGSIVAYLLGITEIDSIKHKLNFQRFMNVERISLADVDSDWNSDDRKAVKDYLYNKNGLYCCDIITFNTIALKGAIRDIARAQDIPLDEVSSICWRAEDEKEAPLVREEYPELFKYVDMVQGVIVSVGNHPAGVVVSPFPLEPAMGTFTSKTNEYPISQINMKEVDAQNYVKLDILSLDNMGLINQTCEMAGIERLTPNNTPLDDEAVWKSIRDDTTLIFQWESDSAAAYLKQLLSDETIERIKAINPDFSYMDLLSMGNGAIRPAGASYRNELAKGIFRDCGHSALNEMMAPTLGYLVYQEQIIQFLHEFCGYSMGEADVVRRHFAKKTGTEDDIPRIEAGFIKTMREKYGVGKEEAESLIGNFLQVIKDASDYLFSLNHSDPYSCIGYICGYLRYYYPYEFLTTALNIFEDKQDKTIKIIQYAKKNGIRIEGIKFRYSQPEYVYNKETETIYKGMKSIKYMNRKIGRELNKLGKNDFEDFYELLQAISEETSIDSRQLDILIKLDYFSEFGNPKKLLYQVKLFNKWCDRKQVNKDDLSEREKKAISNVPFTETEKLYKIENPIGIIRCLDNSDSKETSLQDKIRWQLEFLGYIDIIIPTCDPKVAYVADVNSKYYNRVVELYRLQSGATERVKVKGKSFEQNPFQKGDVIQTLSASEEMRWRKTPDGFEQIDEFETILKRWRKVES